MYRLLVFSVRSNLTKCFAMASQIVWYYDLETTGLNHPIGIVSIGAIVGDKKFHRYLMPRYTITLGAYNIHGISKEGDNLLLNGKPINKALSAEDGIRKFIRFIQKNTSEDDEVILCAHNNHKYDMKVLINNMNELGIPLPSNFAFSDSMRIMKNYQKGGVYVLTL